MGTKLLTQSHLLFLIMNRKWWRTLVLIWVLFSWRLTTWIVNFHLFMDARWSSPCHFLHLRVELVIAFSILRNILLTLNGFQNLPLLIVTSSSTKFQDLSKMVTDWFPFFQLAWFSVAFIYFRSGGGGLIWNHGLWIMWSWRLFSFFL